MGSDDISGAARLVVDNPIDRPVNVLVFTENSDVAFEMEMKVTAEQHRDLLRTLKGLSDPEPLLMRKIDVGAGRRFSFARGIRVGEYINAIADPGPIGRLFMRIGWRPTPKTFLVTALGDEAKPFRMSRHAPWHIIAAQP